ncbi:hypothetical protein J5N97_000647 [Dioscorea zingiberensis]|uniref:Protein kinase domain-containing protein n=1 Tax=Dioscorea zingiberensis TaxID=325984 RepID=A0A9D5BS10_9LILI|nr:hypothetical protein J5N97_000647 [Dioscorea zingiberensis]
MAATRIILSTTIPLALILVLLAVYLVLRTRYNARRRRESLEAGGYGEEGEPEELLRFSGGEHLTAHDILDAPGEVVGKSGYGTLYRAAVQRGGAALLLLRFVRPACAGRTKEILPAVSVLGTVRHPNLVPLRAMYVGPRGEKLFVHPFYLAGNLSQFLHDGNAEAHRWEIIYKISLGIAKGLDHLHTGLQKPLIHGNLKSNNILLEADFRARISDYGLHLLLNPTAGQEMLEAAAAQGYKAPELIKMKEATKESDIYSMGVIFLEMITRKEPVNNNFLHSKDQHLPTSLRNLVLEHNISNIFSSELLKQSNQSATSEECLLMYFQVAMACCSPSPALRPDIKQVIRKLEEIER